MVSRDFKQSGSSQHMIRDNISSEINKIKPSSMGHSEKGAGSLGVRSGQSSLGRRTVGRLDKYDNDNLSKVR